MVPINGMMLKKSFATLRKSQFKVTVECEKHIYTIPAKHSYQYLRSIVKDMRYAEYGTCQGMADVWIDGRTTRNIMSRRLTTA